MAEVTSNQAWITYALTDDDVAGALTLCFSLKGVGTSRKVGVIASPIISPRMRKALYQTFDLFFNLDESQNSAGLKNEDFAKLFVFSLKSLGKCAFVAPTMVAIMNPDNVFQDFCGRRDIFVLPEIENNDMAIFLVRPSLYQFQALIDGLCAQKLPELQKYVETWTHNQTNTNVKVIPAKYCQRLSSINKVLLGDANSVAICNVVNMGFNVNTGDFGYFAQMILEQRNLIFNDSVNPLLLNELAFESPEKITFHVDTYQTEPVAIVGMSCRYPSANNLEEFWKLLVNGEDGTSFPPENRWGRGKLLSTADCRKTNAGFLKHSVDDFDAKFFGISPKEVVFLDPQHRILHELVWEGLEDATLNPHTLRGTNGGVFIGSWTNEYKDILTQTGNADFYRMYMGNSIGAAAARISHFLGLTGPSLATESGCSSAMVALHLACKSLQRGESSFALACGVNLLLTPFDKDTLPMVLSPVGLCKTFDANADGFARAEGCGVLVLKRLSDAVRDQDKIWALIRGTGMTQEGISKSMGTPTIYCESLAMIKALEDANLLPEDISYVEAHGTGTSVGDPLEIAAIAKAYNSVHRQTPLIIGSVKTNVGHTESCSGITGIMKVVLSMQNQLIPCHRNLTTLNPSIDLEAIPAEIPLKPISWPRQEGKARYAGVSSFGITGTDAHVIIQEGPEIPVLNGIKTLERPLHIMKISAKTEEALTILLENYKCHLSDSQHDFKNLAYTANIGRADFSHRAVVVAKSNEDATMALKADKIVKGEISVDNSDKVCFLFCGQGSQYPGMAKQLYETSPVFRMYFQYCVKFLKEKYNIDVIEAVWSSNTLTSNQLSRTIYSQTSIFCVEYALLKVWESWGVKPEYALGHSLGEFAAAVCAGILSVEDALILVAERSLLIDLLPHGKMLIIKEDLNTVQRLMKEFSGNDQTKLLDYAAINSNDQTVVAGDSEVVLEFMKYCELSNLKCILLEATHAFHSKHMDPMLNNYRQIANSVSRGTGNSCAFISGMTGTITNCGEINADYWVAHTREKVRFVTASKEAVKLGCKIFIEIGPQPVLSALTLKNSDTPLTCLPSMKRNTSEWDTLLNAVGRLYTKGIAIDWNRIDQFYLRQKCRLPTYPFNGKSFWPENLAAICASIHPLLGSPIPNASAIRLFQSTLSMRSLEWVKDHAIGESVIFPAAGFLEICLAAGLATLEGATQPLSSPTTAMKVENLLIESPLPFDESKSCIVQTVVALDRSSDDLEDWTNMQVKIHRIVEPESTKWLLHARASFSPVPSAEEKLVTFDVDKFLHTRSLPSESEDITEVYNNLGTLGLKFGPTFRSIEKVWRSTNNELLAKLNVKDLQLQAPYLIHPVIADAMIQAIMMLCAPSTMKKKLHVPIKIGKFVWLLKPQTVDVYIHTYFCEDNKHSSAIDVTSVLIDSAGNVLAIMSSVELIDTTVKAIDCVLVQQTTAMPDMFEEVWKTKVGPHQFSMDIEKASGKFYTDEFEVTYENHNQNPSTHIKETLVELDKFVYWNILLGIYECNWKPLPIEDTFSEDELFKELKLATEHREYFGFAMEILEQEGVLIKELDQNFCKVPYWKVAKTPPTIEEVIINLKSPMVSNLTAKFQSTILFGKLGESLSAILKGEQSALKILFPPEKTHPSAGDYYNEYAKILDGSEVVLQVSTKNLENIKKNVDTKKCILRVLEVGAGTGFFTHFIVNALDAHDISFEYTYTDISAVFFPAAEKRFEKHAKNFVFKKLNIEEDPLDQGFSPDYYDYVVNANVIHATKNIRQSLLNMRMILKPHGQMHIQEMTKVLRPETFSFGLLEGFWRFEDRDVRPKHCTLTKPIWRKVLEETGFQVNGMFSTNNDSHSYICCERTKEQFYKFLDWYQYPCNAKAWLVFHTDSKPLSKYIYDRIHETTNRQSILVTAAEKYEENTANNKFCANLRKNQEKDFAQLFQSLHNRNVQIEGVVYCWGLNKDQTSQEEILQPYFYLSKAVLNTGQRFLPRVYAVTSGVVPLDDNDTSHFYSSTLWGFTKSMFNEHSGINGRCMEVADGRWDAPRLQEIFLELWNLDRDSMAAFKGESRFIPKLQLHKPVINALSLPKGTDRFQLILPKTNAVADLQFGLLEACKLMDDEVEVQIKVSALNFRDVLSIIKPSEDFKDVNTVGFDFAGVIKNVGQRVRKWRVGDRVCGCNIHFTAMPSHLKLQEDLLLPLPGITLTRELPRLQPCELADTGHREHMSFCEAATMPAIYITSIQCLLEVANIKKGDVVLIHAASGGVGLSAIEICKHIGCNIIATAGSKRKQNFLHSLGIEHIFHSRNTNYETQILEMTDGRGVDVVLNSLTSEGFKEATLRVCSQGARFVEMSKLNIWTTEHVKQLRPDVQYTAVDLSQFNKEEWTHLLDKLKPLLMQKVVKPIPFVRFDAVNIREGIQYMQKARHIGKIVCVLPEIRYECGKMKIHTPMFSERSTYLITGGLGGIGFAVCLWMLQNGAKHVVLCGRREPSSAIQAKIDEINSKGMNIVTVQLDVGNFEDCKALIEDLKSKLNLPPLKGIMHAAGTLADSLIVNKDWPNLASTFTTKIDGTLNLHNLTKNINLEHFVLFSSMAAILGAPGQCNHTAGNSFEDAFAYYRNSMGLPATTINWGQWGEVGIATEVDIPGIRTLSTLHGLTGLEYALKTQRTQTVILNVSSWALLSKFYPHLPTYLDERIWRKNFTAIATSIVKSNEFWEQYDSALSLNDKTDVLKLQLQNILRLILKLEDHEQIEEDVDLQEMGVDSLMFVEINNGLQTLLGERLSINSNSLKDCNTVNLLASCLISQIERSTNCDSSKPSMEEVNELIREDCYLPEFIAAKSHQTVVDIGEVKTVLLTGGTGNLGPYILYRLSTLPQISQIICLMRPGKTLSMHDRMSNCLSKLDLLNKVDMEKIRFVSGNVAYPQLGMEQSDWIKLTGQVDGIFHCAASVQHSGHYKKSNLQNDMRAVNIGGTANILEFACENKLKHVYHASSLAAVLTLDDGRVSEMWPETGEYDGVTTMAYPITKYVSDVLVKQAVERGIPCKSFRLPYICGESSTGRCSIEQNHIMLRYIFILRNKIMPSAPFLLNLLPVDICANASISLFFEEKAESGIYNLSHCCPSADQEFVSIAKKLGYNIEIVDTSEFLKVVNSSEDKVGSLKIFGDLYDEETVMNALSNAPILKMWMENEGESKDMWYSGKVTRFIPDFFYTQKPAMEYVYNDLLFCKSKGWLKPFGI